MMRQTGTVFFSQPNNTGIILEEDLWARSVGAPSLRVSLSNALKGIEMLPGTFVLFTEQAPYLERCMPNVKDEDGLHTIVGRW